MANPIDYAGMLTGISQDPNQQATALLSKNASGMGPIGQAVQAGRPMYREMAREGLGGLMGKDLRSPAQKVMEELKKLNPRDPKDQPKIVKLLSTIDQQKAFEIEAQFKAQQEGAIAQDERRSTLIQAALDLGLTSTAELLQNGGDMDKAAEQIRKQEEKDVVSQQGRRGKKAVAESRNAGEAIGKAIDRGEYDGLSVSEFISTISGEEADLKVFNDANGVSKPFRVNEAGKVWNNESKKWAFPSELGLTQAPQVSKVLSQQNTIVEKLTEGSVDNFLELNEKARAAEKVLVLNNRSKQLMEEGITSGFGATFQLNVLRLGKELGILPASMTDQVAATETFIATRARQVLAVLGSGAVGSGTGISDKDIEFLKETEAASIALDAESIQRLLRIEEQASRYAINKNNEALDRLKNVAGSGLDASTAASYFVPLPEVQYETPNAALKYLQPQG
jgi:hypothetical protein